MGSRAQAAIEYLLVLIAVIIITIVVMAALGMLPSLAGRITEQQSTAYWANEDVGITRAAIREASVATCPIGGVSCNNQTFVFRNNRNFQVTMKSLSIVGEGGAVVYTPTIFLRLAPSGEEAVTFWYDLKCTKNQIYSYDINITYTDNAGITYYVIGVMPLVGTCQ